jgi:dATP pyrophosphohydrolase
MWQFLSGGAEDLETAFEAAKREAHEEAGIPPDSIWIELDSRASIPHIAFSLTSHWPPELLVVPEFSFAVDVSGVQLTLSHEHDEIRWLDFKDATAILKWDSNRVALWELNERLRKSNSDGR